MNKQYLKGKKSCPILQQNFQKPVMQGPQAGSSLNKIAEQMLNDENADPNIYDYQNQGFQNTCPPKQKYQQKEKCKSVMQMKGSFVAPIQEVSDESSSRAISQNSAYNRNSQEIYSTQNKRTIFLDEKQKDYSVNKQDQSHKSYTRKSMLNNPQPLCQEHQITKQLSQNCQNQQKQNRQEQKRSKWSLVFSVLILVLMAYGCVFLSQWNTQLEKQYGELLYKNKPISKLPKQDIEQCEEQYSYHRGQSQKYQEELKEKLKDNEERRQQLQRMVNHSALKESQKRNLEYEMTNDDL